MLLVTLNSYYIYIKFTLKRTVTLATVHCDLVYQKCVFICTLLQATLVRNTTDENESRILYEYLAEASVVFPRVFPVM